jgi:hypothetical protein
MPPLSNEIHRFAHLTGLLSEENFSAADLDSKIHEIFTECSSLNLDTINPAFLGEMFQGVMDKFKRREFGAHYTSEDNILKVINPLFMDELREEFNSIKENRRKLEHFHKKISHIKFLDPACGCGNFLIITYRELRRLELEVLKIIHAYNTQNKVSDSESVQVSVKQFFGIEIEKFPCQIAQIGMWLMEHQSNLEVSDFLGKSYARLPLKQSPTIVHGNALRLDWREIVSTEDLSYILGNPPFAGSKFLTQEQRDDIKYVFGKDTKGSSTLDYVAPWYYKAAEYIAGTEISVSFVSTNSINQGEQAPVLWKSLIQKFGINIDFVWRAFKWGNDAKGKATVFCNIIGFSSTKKNKSPVIFTKNGGVPAKNINPYLVDAPNVFLEKRQHPINEVPEIGIGNKPIDNGNFLFTEDQKNEFVAKEPLSAKYFKKFMGSDEFINRYCRWCLWLGDCPPQELHKMPEAIKRVDAVRKFRLASKSEPTKKLANTPTRFHVENMPNKQYLAIPRVSSHKRKYIPIAFLSPDILSSDSMLIMPEATTYHFGIMTSIVHMSWIRVVCGRLGLDYRYSKDIVYNNFPWPLVNENQRKAIALAAERVIQVRKLLQAHTGFSLAHLYDPTTMTKSLLKVHESLDRTVLKAYNFSSKDVSEPKIVARLMEIYQDLTMGFFQNR